MKLNKSHKLLLLIFFVILLSRLYFIFQTPYLENEGYLVQRYVENILNNGRPLFFDQLSYNGREVLYSPIYYYILAFFGSFLGISLALKLIPSIFISGLVFVVYGLSKKIIKNDNLALFISLMAGFVPILFVETLINASIYTLVVPLTFYLISLFMDMDKSLKIHRFVVLSLLLNLLHPSAALFSMGLIFYYILSSTEGKRLSNLKEELILFNIFSTFFIQFVIYKKAFLAYGSGVIWNNIPVQILSSYFEIDVLGMIYRIGTLALVFGLFGIIWSIIKKKQNMFLINGFAIATLILLWLRLIDPRVGFTFLSVALVIGSVITLNLLFEYLQKTKIPYYGISSLVIIFSLFGLSLAVPSFYFADQNIHQNVPTDYEMLVLDWIKENSLPDVTILAPLGRGHLITSRAGKRNVLDDNFLLAPETSERFEDVEIIYSTKSETDALKLIQKYNADFILIPIETELKYGEVKWIDDTSCFEGIFFGTPKVYKVIC